MSTDETSGNSTESFRSVRASVVDVPVLQRPSLGGLEIIRKVRFPDEDVAKDRRLHIDVRALEHLLAIARSSGLNRVVIHGVAIEVEVIATPHGHVFESWALTGYPVPEGGGRDLAVQADVGQIKRRSERGQKR